MASQGWKWKRRGFVEAMKSPALVADMRGRVSAAKAVAEESSGGRLRFGCGVDTDGPTSAHGWVGASSADRRTGKPNRGLNKKQSEALRSVGW